MNENREFCSRKRALEIVGEKLIQQIDETDYRKGSALYIENNRPSLRAVFIVPNNSSCDHIAAIYHLKNPDVDWDPSYTDTKPSYSKHSTIFQKDWKISHYELLPL